MNAAPQHEIKSADAVIAEDVICQSFIQSSCTLAYACLLIRRRRFELAAHVLHSLEAKQASRFKDMVFYLHAQIGIETGEYAMVKKRLVPRVHQHPNDMVALSLLEACIHSEFSEREAQSPAPVFAPTFGNAEAAEAAALAASFRSTELPPHSPDASATPIPAHHSAYVPAHAFPEPAPHEAPAAVAARPAEARQAHSPAPSRAPEVPSAAPANAMPPGYVGINLSALPSVAEPVVRDGSSGHRAGASGDADLGLYQGIASDPNTLAVGVWGGKGRAKTFCRAPDLEPLMSLLPRELPAALQAACSALESGPIHKICFSFQHLTASTFHAGVEGMAHLTGPLNQNLLSIVRAENTFKRAAAGGPAVPAKTPLPGAHA